MIDAACHDASALAAGFVISARRAGLRPPPSGAHQLHHVRAPALQCTLTFGIINPCHLCVGQVLWDCEHLRGSQNARKRAHGAHSGPMVRRDSALPDPRHILAAADANGAAFDPDGARVDLEEMSRVAIAVVGGNSASTSIAGDKRF